MTLIDTTSTAVLQPVAIASASDELALQRRRAEVVAMTILFLNIFDVLVTRLVLRTHPASHEGNNLIAHFIFTRWIWLPKVGVPLLVVVSSARSRVTRANTVGMLAVAGIYWAVIAWNLHILLR